MTDIYIVSRIHCSESGDPGTVTQNFFDNFETAKKFVEEQKENIWRDSYNDQEWDNGDTFPHTYTSDEARSNDEYSYFQVDKFNLEELNSPNSTLISGI